MRDNSKYPHVFQPLTIRSVTIKNRLADKIRSRYATDVYVVEDCVSKNRNFFHANQEAYHAAMKHLKVPSTEYFIFGKGVSNLRQYAYMLVVL